MKNALATVAALALLLPIGAAAQSAAPAAKAPAAKAAQPARPAKAAKAAEPAPPPAADEDQKVASQHALLGDYECEFKQVVKLEPSPKHAHYVDLSHGKNTWLMKPVLSSTGALRLEDVRGRMLMIQIANKSMVMDTQIGQRVVDGCQHEKQREFARNMNAAPAGELLKN